MEIHLNHEMVWIESGALSYMIGKVSVHSQIVPSFGGMFKSLLSGEAIYRPTYFDSGVITLESSLRGFHLLELQGESWILEKGAYWASEGSNDLSFQREKVMTSLWAGEGLVYLKTRVQGQGKVVVTTRGPVEWVTLAAGEELVAEGQCVVCRSADVSFEIRRPTKNYLGRFTSGEPFVRVYRGPGRVLLNPAPYWRYFMHVKRGARTDSPSRMTG